MLRPCSLVLTLSLERVHAVLAAGASFIFPAWCILVSKLPVLPEAAMVAHSGLDISSVCWTKKVLDYTNAGRDRLNHAIHILLFA